MTSTMNQNAGMNTQELAFNDNTPIHAVLRNMMASEHLMRSDFGQLAEFMPGAASVAASSLSNSIPDFFRELHAGRLKALPVLIAMAAHLEAREAAH